MIVNYTGCTVIINTDNKRDIDYSAINNYLPNENSIILADKQQSEFVPMSNVYIITEDCKYLGHFDMRMMKNLPKDPIIYVGIKKGENVQLSNPKALPSDVDFGLTRILDRSMFIIMILNPYYFSIMSFIFVIIVLCALYVAYLISLSIIDHFSK